MFATPFGLRTGMAGRPRHAQSFDGTATGPVIPYDVAATFKIAGRAGNLLQDVINISTDGVFVAVGIGYGFEEDRERPLIQPDVLAASAGGATSIIAGDLTLSALPLAALIEGFRVNPKFAHWVSGNQGAGALDGDFSHWGLATDSVPADRLLGNVLQRIKTPAEISFLFSLVDSGTGREF